MTRKERCALLCALVDADDRNDVPALARLGWILFDLLCQAQQAQCEAVETLEELRTAARAVVMSDGNQASVQQVRDVLAQHGWLRQPAPRGNALQPARALRAEPADLTDHIVAVKPECLFECEFGHVPKKFLRSLL